MKKLVVLLFSLIITMMPVMCYAEDLTTSDNKSEDYVFEVVDDAEIPLASMESDYNRYIIIPCFTIGTLLCGIYILSKRKVEEVKNTEYYENIVGERYMNDLIK